MTLRKKRPLAVLFDVDYRLQYLTELGDSLERLNAVVDWETFRPTLEQTLRREPKGPGGRPAYEYVIMFKLRKEPVCRRAVRRGGRPYKRGSSHAG
ncbi:MAG: hypothetical protein IH600_03170 [Bacteroidetes bacterium]|nr:hypothetical protein [Bacteroidota bacterium]